MPNPEAKNAVPEKREGFFPGAGGLKIYWQGFISPAAGPSGPPLVLVAHGLGEHGGRYRNVIDRLLPLGHPVFLLDHRGHGRSGGKRGHINSFSEYLDDLRTFRRLALEETGRERVILLGHSLGGLIALCFALENPGLLAAVVASSPALRVNAPVPAVKAALGKVLSRLLPSLTMDNGLDPEHLSHDPRVVREYVDDPLVHKKVSARWFTEFTARMEWARAEAPRLRLPLLLLHAGDDRLTDPAGSEQFFQRAGSARKNLIRYPGLYHAIFNEVGKEQVFQDLEKWIAGSR